jgi:NAD(P)-dependent dehydrogenase (short-subunit alcohol dehydrogenase family)
MAERLAGKVALITGAGGGIGSEMAKLFAREGAAVVVNDVREEWAAPVTEAIRASGGRAETALGDISVSGDVDTMFAAAREAFGGLDVLVNNGFAVFNDWRITDLSEEDWDRTVDVCLKGPFLCTKRALPMMKERGGGSVITISSVNALFGVGETAYTAAKGGLISMMRLVAAEYGDWNIRSNVICPGTIATKMCMDHWNKYPDGYRRLLDMYPLGRIGQPIEVAQYALFLASDESSFVTGAVQVIDGGLLAGRRLEER